MIKLEEMLKNINYINRFEVPIIGVSSNKIENNKYKNIYNISITYEYIRKYFKKRKLPDFYLLLNEYDDRCYFLQHYKRIPKYKRKWFIGPIIGLKIKYKRKHKFANYAGVKTPLIKYIKNEKDFDKYYKECYCNMNILSNV
jgi:hypothetical protein